MLGSALVSGALSARSVRRIRSNLKNAASSHWRHLPPVDQRPPGCGPELLLVPGPTLPELDGLAAIPLLLADPVVVPFFMLPGFDVMPLAAPGPTLPSLNDTNVPVASAIAVPAVSARMQADARMIFFMLTYLLRRLKTTVGGPRIRTFLLGSNCRSHS